MGPLVERYPFSIMYNGRSSISEYIYTISLVKCGGRDLNTMRGNLSRVEDVHEILTSPPKLKNLKSRLTSLFGSRYLKAISLRKNIIARREDVNLPVKYKFKSGRAHPLLSMLRSVWDVWKFVRYSFEMDELVVGFSCLCSKPPNASSQPHVAHHFLDLQKVIFACGEKLIIEE